MSRLYAMRDAMSVTAVVDPSGKVVERYGYNGLASRYMTSTFGSLSASGYDWETLLHSYRYDTESGFTRYATVTSIQTWADG